MKDGWSISYFWSRAFLTSRSMLHTLFWINFLGTIYGYIWYWPQLQEVAEAKPAWMLILVPDSPTASLFFTLTLLYLLADSYRSPDGLRRVRAEKLSARTAGDAARIGGTLRSAVEAVACAASFKYGIWAVAVIVAANLQGNPAGWQDWMLSASHLGMAAEALLFARFFRLTRTAMVIAAAWVFASDIVDYGFGVFPSLPGTLESRLGEVALFTVLLSAVSVLIFATLAGRHRMRNSSDNPVA